MDKVPESPVVGIVLPCGEMGDFAKECFKLGGQLDYESYEIILLTDYALERVDGARIFPTGSTTPLE
jgi:hypothetical protein